MQKTILDEVYALLREIDAVHSESEFSVDWLGRSECYIRSLRFKRQLPSVSSVAICASKLQYYGERLLKAQQHTALSKKLLNLSQRCHCYIHAQSTKKWMHL